MAIQDGNISFDNIRDVGVIQETSLEVNPWARLNLTLGQEALWTVTRTSCLHSLEIADSAAVQGEPGTLVTMTVDGEETPIEPGSYAGEIVLTVREDPNAQEPEETQIQEPEAPAETPPALPEEDVPAAEIQQEESQGEEPEITQEHAQETKDKNAPLVVGIAAGAAVLGAVAGVLRRRKS